jgi:hypothetical protein
MQRIGKSVAKSGLIAMMVMVTSLQLMSCGQKWTIQTPELGQSRQEIERDFKGVQKTDLAWTFPSHEWGRDGAWEVRFDAAGLVREAIWHAKPATKGMTYASYLHILGRTMKDMGDGSNDQPTGDTYQVWRMKDAKFTLNLSGDSTSLYFKKSRAVQVMASQE